MSTSETFAEFRKAAKEKADRERGLKEQQVVVFLSWPWIKDDVKAYLACISFCH